MIESHFRPERYVSRQVCFLPEDERAYSDLLRQAFPDIRFTTRLDTEQRKVDNNIAPVIKLRHCIEDCDYWLVDLSLHWNVKEVRMIPVGKEGEWHGPPPPHPRASWQRHNKAVNQTETGYHGSPPNIMSSEIAFFFDPYSRDQRNEANRALRLIEKVSTRRVELFEYPSRKSMGIRENDSVRTGYHALEWARRAPDRCLDLRVGRDRTGAYGRPAD